MYMVSTRAVPSRLAELGWAGFLALASALAQALALALATGTGTRTLALALGEAWGRGAVEPWSHGAMGGGHIRQNWDTGHCKEEPHRDKNESNGQLGHYFLAWAMAAARRTLAPACFFAPKDWKVGTAVECAKEETGRLCLVVKLNNARARLQPARVSHPSSLSLACPLHIYTYIYMYAYMCACVHAYPSTLIHMPLHVCMLSHT